MKIFKDYGKIKDEIISIRRQIHMHPELGFEEYETADTICAFLDKYHIEYERGIAKTGVCAYIGEKHLQKDVFQHLQQNQAIYLFLCILYSLLLLPFCGLDFFYIPNFYRGIYFICFLMIYINQLCFIKICYIKRNKNLIALIDKYDCRKYVYFMSGNDNFLKLAKDMAPDICRCCGAGKTPWEIVDRAIKYDCKKVQLFKPYFNQEMIDKARKKDIVCNVFRSDDTEGTKRFLDMGIDTILTNDYNTISQIVKQF